MIIQHHVFSLSLLGVLGSGLLVHGQQSESPKEIVARQRARANIVDPRRDDSTVSRVTRVFRMSDYQCMEGGKITEMKDDHCVLERKSDGKIVTTKIYYCDVFKDNIIAGKCTEDYGYLPIDLKIGDDVWFHCIIDKDKKETCAFMASITFREKGEVPPSRVQRDPDLPKSVPYHVVRNALQFKRDGKPIPKEFLEKHNLKATDFGGLTEESAPEAPAATPTKDKPLTEKK